MGRSGGVIILLIAGLAAALAGCRSRRLLGPAEESPVVAPVRGTAEAPPDAAPAPAASVEEAGAQAGPPSHDVYAELPPLDGPTLELSKQLVGFTRDDTYVGYTVSRCDPCPEEFDFEAPHRPRIEMSYWYHPELEDDEQAVERRRKKNDDAVDARLARLGVERASAGRVLRGPFPDRELRFAVGTEDGDEAVLLFGAHVPGGPPVFPMRVVVGHHPMRDRIPTDVAKQYGLPRDEAVKRYREDFVMDAPVLAYANVTRDGREIGVVAVAMGTMWYEAAAVARMPTRTFVAEVYEQSARAFDGVDDARAATLRDRARALQSEPSPDRVP